MRRVAVFYGSTGTVDDQAWGALWLHKATRDQTWLDKVPPALVPLPAFMWHKGLA